MHIINYSVKDINTFKGIKKSNGFNYAIYHRASNLFIEKYNSGGMYELIDGRKINQFQLTEPLIAGERFFKYALYYNELYLKIETLVERLRLNDGFIIPESLTGEKYVKRLFINVLMAFADRFSENALTLSRCKLLYKWCYILRVTLRSVYLESINKYALGKGSINRGLNMFSMISEMSYPEELDSVILDTVERPNEKYKEIYCDGEWKCDINE